jgi:hypothetical protein
LYSECDRQENKEVSKKSKKLHGLGHVSGTHWNPSTGGSQCSQQSQGRKERMIMVPFEGRVEKDLKDRSHPTEAWHCLLVELGTMLLGCKSLLLSNLKPALVDSLSVLDAEPELT